MALNPDQERKYNNQRINGVDLKYDEDYRWFHYPPEQSCSGAMSRFSCPKPFYFLQ